MDDWDSEQMSKYGLMNHISAISRGLNGTRIRELRVRLLVVLKTLLEEKKKGAGGFQIDLGLGPINWNQDIEEMRPKIKELDRRRLQAENCHSIIVTNGK